MIQGIPGSCVELRDGSDGAQLDLNSAVALDSDFNADAYAYRGYIKLVLGQPKEAVADLEKSAELLVWPYNVLWLHLARLKAGLPDAGPRSLANNAITLPNLGGQAALAAKAIYKGCA